MTSHREATVRVRIPCDVTAVPKRKRTPRDFTRYHEIARTIGPLDARTVARLPGWTGRAKYDDGKVDLMKGSDGSFLVACSTTFDRWANDRDVDAEGERPVTVADLEEKVFEASEILGASPRQVFPELPDDARVTYDGVVDLEDDVSKVEKRLGAHVIVDGRLAVRVDEPVLEMNITWGRRTSFGRKVNTCAAPPTGGLTGFQDAYRYVGFGEWATGPYRDALREVLAVEDRHPTSVHYTFEELLNEVEILDPEAFEYDRTRATAPFAAREIIETVESQLLALGDHDLFAACVALARAHPQSVPGMEKGFAPPPTEAPEADESGRLAAAVLARLAHHDARPFVAEALRKWSDKGLREWVRKACATEPRRAPPVLDTLAAM